MSVMERVRGTTDSLFMQLMFGAIVLSFVFWGVGSQGQTSRVVAEVNGDRITDTEYNKAMRRATRGRAMSPDAEASMSQQVLNQMISDKVMLLNAADMGIEVSDYEIAYTIRNYDAFQDEGGKFSTPLYERTLQSSGWTRQQFEQTIREDLMRNRLRELAAYAVQVSPGEVEAYYVETNSSLSLRWVRVGEASFRDDVVISDADLTATAEAQAEKIKSIYEAEKDRRFTVPRVATVSTILLRTDIGDLAPDAVAEQMEDIVKELEGGADFAELARRWSEDPSALTGGALGELSEPRMDASIAAAVFAAEIGGLTEVVKTDTSFQIIKVEAVADAVVTSLEDATEEIARELIVKERSPKLAEAFAGELMASWKADGEPSAEVLTEQGLTIGEAANLTLDVPSIRGLGPADDVLAAAANAANGDVLDELFELGGAKVIVQVVERNEADMTAFEEEREALRQRLLNQERLSFVGQWSDDLVAAANTRIYLK